MPARLLLRLQTLILTVLFPALLVVTVGAGWWVYTELQAIILEGFDRKLRAVSTVTGTFIDGDDHRRIHRRRSEATPEYLRYVEPMRRVMARANLTYLYSQVTRGRDSIEYVLDGTQGEDHSPIGSMDLLPPATVTGARAVAARGDVFVSGVQEWEQWGLIKTGFAPIRARDGSIVGMAGADVNISVIRDRTRLALAEVGLAAVVSLLVGGAVALFISRKLVLPLAQVREAALLIAAGEYGHRIELRALDELEELSRSFNAMSEALAASFAELTEANRVLEERRRRGELRLALASPPGDAAALPEGGAVSVEWIGGSALSPDASGYLPLPGEERLLVWVARGPAEPLAALALRRAVGIVAGRLLGRPGAEWEEARARLEAVFPQVCCFALLDARSGEVLASARDSFPVVVGSPARGLRRVDLRTHPALSPAPGEILALASGDPLAALHRSRAARERGWLPAAGDGAADAEGPTAAGLLVVVAGRARPRRAGPRLGDGTLSRVG